MLGRCPRSRLRPGPARLVGGGTVVGSDLQGNLADGWALDHDGLGDLPEVPVLGFVSGEGEA